MERNYFLLETLSARSPASITINIREKGLIYNSELSIVVTILSHVQCSISTEPFRRLESRSDCRLFWLISGPDIIAV